ncbi:MAG: hypothetical protein OEY77_00145 [Nitrospira sp.]|nr:hypothetical protein [Nitrospira sp.]
MVERPCWQRDWPDVSRGWLKGLYMWVCINCGNRLDAVIAANRAQQAERTERIRHDVLWQECKRQLRLLQEEVAYESTA